MPKEKETKEVAAILDLIETLTTKVSLDDSLSYITKDQYERIIKGVNTLGITIHNHKEVSERSHNRLDELTDIITGMASLDFSKKAYVGEENNHLDYIAIGLNLLSFQLQKQIQPLLYVKQLINVTEEPVVITDLNYIIQSMNPAAERLFGRVEKILFESSLIGYIANFSDLRPNSESARLQLGINKNEIITNHTFEVYNIRNEKGEDAGLGFVCIDRIIANTNLADLTKRYDVDFNRIQHDTMSPIKNIYGLSELGQMTDNCEEKINYFKLIEQCIKSVEVHIKDLFDMLTIIGNKEKKVLIHFGEIIQAKLNELNFLPGFSSVKFNINIQNEKAFYSNQKLLNSIFHNLMSNAVKYKRSNVPSEANITVKDVDNGITIEVKDNGIGILPEHLENIFKPHFRATEQSEGKGLGLYILKKSIKELGGNITTESYYGKGTAFKIYIPDLTQST